MGEPPPMSRYCCSIFGVLLLAIHGASNDWNGKGMRSPSEKRFLRKGPVSSTYWKMSATEMRPEGRITVAGPPMFSITIAEWVIKTSAVNARF